MAVKQIPNLPAAISLNGTEQLEAVQAGTSVRVTSAQLAQLASPTTAFPLVPALGGTGISSYAIGDLIVATGTATLSRFADVATGNVLLSGGVGAVPAYGKVTLTGHVSGILPVANGGTNSAVASGTALDNITGFSGTGLMRRTGAGAYSFGTAVSLTAEVTGVLPVANGGTNSAVASGTALDNITGFSSTGLMQRTGAGAYSFTAVGPAKHFDTYALFAAASASDIANFQCVYVNDSGAVWIKVGSMPSHSCRLQIGSQWFELQAQNGEATPLMLGYIADSGTSANTVFDALQSNTAVSTIKLGKGGYQIKNFRPRTTGFLTIEGLGPYTSFLTHDGDATGTTATNSMIYNQGNNLTIKNLALIGTPCTVAATTVGPIAGIYCTRPSGAPTQSGTSNLKIENVRVYGGESGIVIGGVGNFQVSNALIEWQGTHGLAITSCAESGLVNDVMVRYTAEEGIKRGDDEDNFTNNVHFDGVTIFGCGSTNTSSMNDSFDNFLRNGQFCVISNMRIFYAAGGGMGYKWAQDADSPINNLSGQIGLKIKNSYIHCVQGIRAISNQITTPLPTAYDRVTLMSSECDIDYDYVSHQCTVASIATTSGSRIVTFETTTAHDLSPGDTCWLKMWTTLTLGGISATEFMSIQDVYTVPTSTTFTVVLRETATATATDTTGGTLWLWNRKPLAMANNSLSCTNGSDIFVLNFPRNGLAANNEVELAGATGFANYTAADLAGVFIVQSVAGDVVSLYGPILANATTSGGGSAITVRRIKKTTSARGFFLQGCSNVSISGTVNYAYVGIGLNPTSTSNVYADTITNLNINNVACNVCTINLQVNRGTINNMTGYFSGAATQNSVLVSNTTVAINNPRFVGVNFQTNSKRRQTAGAQLCSVIGGRFINCLFEAPYGYALRNVAESSGAATSDTLFMGCTFKGTTFEGIRHDSGTVTLVGCMSDLPTTLRTYVLNAGTLNVDRVNRGFSSGAPTGAGSLGDYYGITPVSGSFQGYICTTASSSAATWKTTSAIS